MNQITSVILLVIMIIVGGGTTLAMVVGIPAVILWKIYRKIRYGTRLTD